MDQSIQGKLRGRRPDNIGAMRIDELHVAILPLNIPAVVNFRCRYNISFFVPAVPTLKRNSIRISYGDIDH